MAIRTTICRVRSVKRGKQRALGTSHETVHMVKVQVAGMTAATSGAYTTPVPNQLADEIQWGERAKRADQDPRS